MEVAAEEANEAWGFGGVGILGRVEEAVLVALMEVEGIAKDGGGEHGVFEVILAIEGAAGALVPHGNPAVEGIAVHEHIGLALSAMGAVHANGFKFFMVNELIGEGEGHVGEHGKEVEPDVYIHARTL